MVVALDVGGTHIRIAEIRGNRVINKKQINTPPTKKEILHSITSLLSSYSDRKVICVCVAGFVRDGKVLRSPHLDLDNTDIKKFLHNKFHSSVFVENDARCAGLAEQKYGYGKGKNNFVFITLGTGIGSAVFIDGKLYSGNGFAGEIGHMLVNNQEFEQIASGNASQKIASSHGMHGLSGEEIHLLAKKGDPRALKVYEEIGNNLGAGILNIVYTLDPEVVVFGGGFSKVPFIYSQAKRFIPGRDILKRSTKIVPSKMKDDAGLIGAALLPSINR